MRTKKEIEKEMTPPMNVMYPTKDYPTPPQEVIIELLFDIRDLLDKK